MSERAGSTTDRAIPNHARPNTAITAAWGTSRGIAASTAPAMTADTMIRSTGQVAMRGDRAGLLTLWPRVAPEVRVRARPYWILALTPSFVPRWRLSAR